MKRKLPQMKYLSQKTVAAILCCLALAIGLNGQLFAQSNWIKPMTTYVSVGDSVRIQLGSGHKFPVSEIAEDHTMISSCALTPSGEQITLQFVAAEKVLEAEYVVRESGVHHLFFEVDRGLICKTDSGWQEGDRDDYPESEMLLNYYLSASSYLTTDDTIFCSQSPLGIKFELSVNIVNDSLFFTAFSESLVVAGVEVAVHRTDSETAATFGTTDSLGLIVYVLPADYQGELLFVATYRKDQPQDSNYDADLFRSFLYFDFLRRLETDDTPDSLQ